MAVVSHELKSPLHGIIGLAKSLSQSKKCEDRKGQLKMVKSYAVRLLQSENTRLSQDHAALQQRYSELTKALDGTNAQLGDTMETL